MPRSQSAAVSRRRLRSALRSFRIQQDLTQKEVADALRWSSTKLMRIEAGKVGVTFTDLKALLEVYAVTDPLRVNELQGLADTARKTTIGGEYKDVLSKEFAEFLEYEEAAEIIRQFEPNVIPGPLQTPAYAKAVLNALSGEDKLDPNVLDRRVRARLERQKLITQDDGPQAFFLIDEAAALRLAGAESNNSGLMDGQLRHLKELSTYPNITIQFVPLSLGLYPTMRSAYEILQFDDPMDDGLVYLESAQGDAIIRDDQDTVARYIDNFQDMELKATPADAVPSAIDQILDWMKKGTSVLVV